MVLNTNTLSHALCKNPSIFKLQCCYEALIKANWIDEDIESCLAEMLKVITGKCSDHSSVTTADIKVAMQATFGRICGPKKENMQLFHNFLRL